MHVRQARSSAILFVIVWLFLAVRLMAQAGNVTGIVLDDRTDKPIGNVLVYVEGGPVFTQTDDAGRFSLTLDPGRHTIAGSIIGYPLLRASVDVIGTAVVPVTFRLSEGLAPTRIESRSPQVCAARPTPGPQGPADLSRPAGGCPARRPGLFE